MNQAELARLTERSETLISRLLSGDRTPSWGTMMMIKQALDWSLDRQGESLNRGTYAVDLRYMMDRERQPT